MDSTADIYYEIGGYNASGEWDDDLAGDTPDIADTLCSLQMRREVERLQSQGEERIIDYRGYFLDIDLRDGSLVVVKTGPQAGKKFWVRGLPENVRGHHLEAMMEYDRTEVA